LPLKASSKTPNPKSSLKYIKPPNIQSFHRAILLLLLHQPIPKNTHTHKNTTTKLLSAIQAIATTKLFTNLKTNKNGLQNSKNPQPKNPTNS
jgi:hypothetical protein